MGERGTPVVYLIGTSGHPNYGDELITAGWLRHYSRTHPDATVWLDSPRPGQSQVLFDGLHPGLRCVDTLFHGCWNAPRAEPEVILEFGERLVGDPGIIPREAIGVENLASVDVVHVLGGAYINDLWPHHLALLGAARSMASRFGARTAITGAALWPFPKGSQDAVAKVLAEFEVVDIRDQATFDAVSPLVPHATRTGDDAFLDLRSQDLDRRSTARTMLSLQSDGVAVPLERVADYVLATLREWQVDQEPVTLVECLPLADTEILPLLQPHLPQLTLVPFAHIWRNGMPMSANARWISTRFHPHLAAAAAGVWGVALPVGGDHYSTAHDNLTDMGSDWIIAPDLDEPVAAAASSRRPYSGNLPSIQRAKREVAAQVFELATQGRRTKS